MNRLKDMEEIGQRDQKMKSERRQKKFEIWRYRK